MSVTIPVDLEFIPSILFENGHVRLALAPNATEIVVSFESASPDRPRDDRNRRGFGEKFLLDSGYSVLSVMTNKANWYRVPDYHQFFESAYLQDILSRFEHVHGYGSSMGAFGALAFAEILHFDTIVAFMPISTLRPDLVPWETRFEYGRGLEWNTPYSDGAEGAKAARKIWAFYDPRNEDARHVDRIAAEAGDRVVHIHVPKSSHAVPAMLQGKGLLKESVLSALQNRDPEVLRSKLKSSGLLAKLGL